MKKRILAISLTFFLVTVAYAINSWSTGYRVAKNGGTKIVEYSSARKKLQVKNSNGLDIFVPTKTSTEKQYFCNNGKNITCCEPVVNGGWSAWYNSGGCSKSCGGGLQKQVRYCNNPTPACGGAACVGSNVRYVSCNTQSCCGNTCPGSVVDWGVTMNFLGGSPSTECRYGAWQSGDFNCTRIHYDGSSFPGHAYHYCNLNGTGGTDTVNVNHPCP